VSGSGEEVSKQMAEVLRLHLTEGKGIRAISRQTGLGRKKVRKLLAVARGKRKPGPARPRTSILSPYDSDIRQMLEDCADIRAPAVLERLREKGYLGGVTVVRDRLQQLRPRPKQEAFFTRSYEPGRMLQVDWADFGFAIPGCARRVSAFVAALAYSRYLFLLFTLSQAMGCFLRCMDLALRFFGGRTLVDVFDNMATVVRERLGRAPVFNPRFLEYARARGLGVQACTPRRPTEKPYVERPIGFIRTRFWPGRRATDLMDLNTQAARWRDEMANNRIHEETGRVPSLVFMHEEKSKLQPLVDRFFDTDDLESTSVSKTFRVSFDRNVYYVAARNMWRRSSASTNDRWNAPHSSVGSVLRCRLRRSPRRRSSCTFTFPGSSAVTGPASWGHSLTDWRRPCVSMATLASTCGSWSASRPASVSTCDGSASGIRETSTMDSRRGSAPTFKHKGDFAMRFEQFGSCSITYVARASSPTSRRSRGSRTPAPNCCAGTRSTSLMFAESSPRRSGSTAEVPVVCCGGSDNGTVEYRRCGVAMYLRSSESSPMRGRPGAGAIG
jgi:transposase